MTVTSTIHNHCTLCDGSGTLDEMIRAALAAGFTDLGISCHGVTPFELSCSLRDEDGYIAAVNAAKRRYAGQIRLALGVEQDHFAPVSRPEAFDYVIGSVHYLPDPGTGRFYSVDDTPELLRACVSEVFHGDAMAMVRAYYDTVCRTVETYRPDVVGHFDLVTKFCEKAPLFDPDDPGYRRTALEALERIRDCGGVFEVNTGAMSRGWRTSPYPAPFLLGQMAAWKLPVTLSADCHSPDTLTFGLEDAAELLRRTGFRSVRVWRDGRFCEEDL